MFWVERSWLSTTKALWRVKVQVEEGAEKATEAKREKQRKKERKAKKLKKLERKFRDGERERVPLQREKQREEVREREKLKRDLGRGMKVKERVEEGEAEGAGKRVLHMTPCRGERRCAWSGQGCDHTGERARAAKILNKLWHADAGNRYLKESRAYKSRCCISSSICEDLTIWRLACNRTPQDGTRCEHTHYFITEQRNCRNAPPMHAMTLTERKHKCCSRHRHAISDSHLNYDRGSARDFSDNFDLENEWKDFGNMGLVSQSLLQCLERRWWTSSNIHLRPNIRECTSVIILAVWVSMLGPTTLARACQRSSACERRAASESTQSAHCVSPAQVPGRGCMVGNM
eukprot:6209660-Pleurochrysis_carterae.AAC.2